MQHPVRGRKSSLQVDAIALIEAAYRLDGTEAEWLDGLASAGAALLDQKLGVTAVTVELNGGQLRLRHATSLGGPPELHQATTDFLRQADPGFMFRAFRFASVSTMTRASGGTEALQAQVASDGLFRLGIGDAIGVLGLDGSPYAVALAAFLPLQTRLSPRFTNRWRRIATHLAAGFRIRRGLDTARAEGSALDERLTEAVLSPRGRLESAGPPAQRAAATLTRAAVAMQLARGKLRNESPDKAVEAWRGLVSGRWSLVDYVDTDGKRFLLARKNAPQISGPAGVNGLERAVLAARARGLALKAIAYDLGLSIPTVSTTLRSGMAKLGLSNDADLVAIFKPIGSR